MRAERRPLCNCTLGVVLSLGGVRLAPEWQRHVKPTAVLLIRNRRLGQHRVPKVKPEVFEIIWPRARVQVEDKVVFPIVPRRYLRQSPSEVFDVAFFRQRISVNRIHG